MFVQFLTISYKMLKLYIIIIVILPFVTQTFARRRSFPKFKKLHFCIIHELDFYQLEINYYQVRFEITFISVHQYHFVSFNL